jgi:hypothetical protein
MNYGIKRFMTNRLMKQWKRLAGEGSGSGEARNADSHVSEQTELSPKNGDTRHNYIPIIGTRSMYPMELLDVPDRRDEIVFEEYEFRDGTFTDINKQEIKWEEEGAIEDVITIVFATNKGGFSLSGVFEEAKIPVDVRRQHLDSSGEIIEGHGSMNSQIATVLKTLVDVEKVHIRFQVCSF